MIDLYVFRTYCLFNPSNLCLVTSLSYTKINRILIYHFRFLLFGKWGNSVWNSEATQTQTFSQVGQPTIKQRNKVSPGNVHCGDVRYLEQFSSLQKNLNQISRSQFALLWMCSRKTSSELSPSYPQFFRKWPSYRILQVNISESAHAEAETIIRKKSKIN